MKSLKKTMRLFGLVLLIVLASLGIGVGGAIPISPNKKRTEQNEIKTELVEVKKDKTELSQLKEIK